MQSDVVLASCDVAEHSQALSSFFCCVYHAVFYYVRSRESCLTMFLIHLRDCAQDKMFMFFVDSMQQLIIRYAYIVLAVSSLEIMLFKYLNCVTYFSNNYLADFLRAKAECFARLCHRLGLSLSVCPSVCHTRELY